MPDSVAVIGAGPAGLVAAKTLSQTARFDVRIYEKADRIGGIWAMDENSTGEYLSPDTPTNLSRFSVGFSDLDWQDVDLGHAKDVGSRAGFSGFGLSDQDADFKPPNLKSSKDSGSKHIPSLPMFPKAWMVNRYLEKYKQRFIDESTILFDREVVNVKRVDRKCQIITRDSEANHYEETFDYLIIASGFFAKPRLMKRDVPGLDENLAVKVLHSSKFRSLTELRSKDGILASKKILVLGGGNSSGEAAANLAMQLSNTQWSPNRSLAKEFEGCKIIHVTPRPLYPLPPFLEIDDGSRSYSPLDLKFYDFSKRPLDLESYGGRQPQEVKDIVHGAIQTIVGGNQSDISPALVSDKNTDRKPAYVALTESYSELVRSGLIEVTNGRVSEIRNDDSGFARAIVQSQAGTLAIDDIAAVVYATGYTPFESIDFLDESIKSSLRYSEEHTRLPLILEQWQTMSIDLPYLSFVGFYEGPYWPIMEMQARLIAERWMSGEIAHTNSYETSQTLLDLRRGMLERENDVPQYAFSDYVGYMEDMSHYLKLERNDNSFEPREGCPSPARYLAPQLHGRESDKIMKDLHMTWQDCHVNGKYVARAVFRALLGHWEIHRRISSAQSSFPSGTLEGTASFHPRSPTSDEIGRSFDLEYIYVESGVFTTSQNQTMTANKRYVYRYSEMGDQLSVWFIRPESNLEVDYKFHDLDFVKPEEARKLGAVTAKADHLCVNDMYWTEYSVPLKGVALHNFQIKHTVRGPSKDYVVTTDYERPKR